MIFQICATVSPLQKLPDQHRHVLGRITVRGVVRRVAGHCGWSLLERFSNESRGGKKGGRREEEEGGKKEQSKLPRK